MMQHDDVPLIPSCVHRAGGLSQSISLVVRAFDFLDKIPRFIEAIARLEAEILGSHFERFLFLHLLTAEQSHPQSFVHRLLERLARLLHLRLQLCTNIVI
jgi:hypothetical protein